MSRPNPLVVSQDRAKILREQGYQAHHIIPEEIMNKNNTIYKKARDVILAAGFDNGSFSRNGIFLPNGKADQATHNKRSVHRGPHPAYTEYVDKQLSELHDKSIEEQKVGVKKLLAELRADLKEGNWTLNKAVDHRNQLELSEFCANLESTGLADSYAASNSNASVTSGAVDSLDGPGGVVVDSGVLKGLAEAPDCLWAEKIVVALPVGPNDKAWAIEASRHDVLGQIVESLKIGRAVGASPYYSLHFPMDGKKSDPFSLPLMFGLIHPVFKDNIVGQIIAHLDYAMKAFMNGVYYSDRLLSDFPTLFNKSPEKAVEQEFLKGYIIDLTKYCSERKIPYKTNEEIYLEHGLELNESHHIDQAGRDEAARAAVVPTVSNLKFHNSARIYAKQKRIRRRGSLFVLDPDFEIGYTIEVTEAQQRKLDEYEQEHGSYPDDFLKFERAYASAAQMIRNVMPTLPIFRPLFELASLLSFACYLTETMETIGRVPCSIGAPERNTDKIFHNDNEEGTVKGFYYDKEESTGMRITKTPRGTHLPRINILPSLPLKRIKGYPVTINWKNIFENLGSSLNNELNDITVQELQGCSPGMSDRLTEELENSLRGHIRPQISPEEVSENLFASKVIGSEIIMPARDAAVAPTTLPNLTHFAARKAVENYKSAITGPLHFQKTATALMKRAKESFVIPLLKGVYKTPYVAPYYGYEQHFLLLPRAKEFLEHCGITLCLNVEEESFNICVKKWESAVELCIENNNKIENKKGLLKGFSELKEIFIGKKSNWRQHLCDVDLDPVQDNTFVTAFPSLYRGRSILLDSQTRVRLPQHLKTAPKHAWEIDPLILVNCHIKINSREAWRTGKPIPAPEAKGENRQTLQDLVREGIVISYRKVTREHSIQFNDNTVEWLTLRNTSFFFKKQNPQARWLSYTPSSEQYDDIGAGIVPIASESHNRDKDNAIYLDNTLKQPNGKEKWISFYHPRQKISEKIEEYAHAQDSNINSKGAATKQPNLQVAKDASLEPAHSDNMVSWVSAHFKAIMKESVVPRSLLFEAYLEYCVRVESERNALDEEVKKTTEAFDLGNGIQDLLKFAKGKDKTDESEYYKDAQRMGKWINKYTTENAYRNVELVRNIFETAFKCDCLKDELYCLIMMQLTGNSPRSAYSKSRAWELLWLACGTFPCSFTIKKDSHGVYSDPLRVVHEFLKSQKNSFANECIKRISKTALNGPRKHAPTSEEVRAIQNIQNQDSAVTDEKYLPRRKVSPLECEIHIPGKSEPYKIKIESFSRARDICASMGDKLGLNLPKNFNLFFEHVGDRVIKIPDDDFFFDFISTTNKQTYKIMFMKKIFSKDDLEKDLVADYMFHYQQELHKLLCGFHNITEKDDAVKLAALIYLARGEKKKIEKIWKELLPCDLVNKFDHSALKDEIMTCWERLCANHPCLFTSKDSKENAKKEFLKIVAEWPAFGSRAFQVKIVKQPNYPELVWMSIDEDSVTFFHPNTKKKIEKFLSSELTWEKNIFRINKNNALCESTLNCAGDKIVAEWPAFGLRVFQVKIVKQPNYPELVWMSTGKDGAKFFHPNTKEKILDFLLSELTWEKNYFCIDQNNALCKPTLDCTEDDLLDCTEDDPKVRERVQNERIVIDVEAQKRIQTLDLGNEIRDLFLDEAKALLKFSDDKIESPLLKESEESKVSSEAQNICKWVNKYTTENVYRSVELVRNIFETAFKCDCLKDELYCLIMMQLTGNRCYKMASRAWELLWLACGTFPCSLPFFKELHEFLKSQKNSFANECIKRISKTALNGPRKHAPTSEEVRAIQNIQNQDSAVTDEKYLPRRKVSPLECEIHIPGKSEPYKIKIESFSRARDICASMGDKLGLNLPKNFNLFFEHVGDRVIKIPDDDFFFDFISTTNKQTYKIMFMKKIFSKDDLEKDLVADYMFHYQQELHKLLCGFHNITEKDDAVKLAALIYLARGEKKKIEEIWKELLPCDLVNKFDHSALKHEITVLTHLTTYKNKSEREAKKEFLKIVAEWPAFGSRAFQVKIVKQPALESWGTVPVWMSIGEDGATFSLPGKTEHFPFSELTWEENCFRINQNNALCEPTLGCTEDDLVTPATSGKLIENYTQEELRSRFLDKNGLIKMDETQQIRRLFLEEVEKFEKEVVEHLKISPSSIMKMYQPEEKRTFNIPIIEFSKRPVFGGFGVGMQKLQEVPLAAGEFVEKELSEDSNECFVKQKGDLALAIFRIGSKSSTGPPKSFGRTGIDNDFENEDNLKQCRRFLEKPVILPLKQKFDNNDYDATRKTCRDTSPTLRDVHVLARYNKDPEKFEKLPHWLLYERCDKGFLPFHIAAGHGNSVALEALIPEDKGGVDVRVNGSAETALFLAQRHVNAEEACKTINELGRLRADPNIRLPDGGSAILVAVRGRREKAALALLEQFKDKIDVNCPAGESEKTPLEYAIVHNMRAVAKALLERGAKIMLPYLFRTQSALNSACAFGHCVDIIINHMKKEAFRKEDDRCKKYNDGLSALHFVAGVNEKLKRSAPKKLDFALANINLLLKNGADPNAKDVHGRTPLDLALVAGNFKIAQLLYPKTKPCAETLKLALSLGAVEVAAGLYNGLRGHKPPLEVDEKVFQLMKTSGSEHLRRQAMKLCTPGTTKKVETAMALNTCKDVLLSGPHSQLAVAHIINEGLPISIDILQVGVATDSIDIVRLWLESKGSLKYRKGDLSCGASQGHLPLPILAAKHGCARVLKELLKFEQVKKVALARPYEYTKSTDTEEGKVITHILSETVRMGPPGEIWNLLRSVVGLWPGSVDTELDKLGSTAAHIAAETRQPSWFSELVKAGADLTRQRGPDNKKQSPFHIAIEMRDKKCLESLIEALPQGTTAFLAKDCIELAARHHFIEESIPLLLPLVRGAQEKSTEDPNRTSRFLSAGLCALACLGHSKNALYGAQQLLKLGADATFNDFEPIKNAARAGKKKLLLLFLNSINDDTKLCDAKKAAAKLAKEVCCPEIAKVLDSDRCEKEWVSQCELQREKISNILNGGCDNDSRSELGKVLEGAENITGMKIRRPSRPGEARAQQRLNNLPPEIPLLHAIIVSGHLGFLQVLPKALNSKLLKPGCAFTWMTERDDHNVSCLTYLNYEDIIYDKNNNKNVEHVLEWLNGIKVLSEYAYNELLVEQDEYSLGLIVKGEGARPEINKAERRQLFCAIQKQMERDYSKPVFAGGNSINHYLATLGGRDFMKYLRGLMKFPPGRAGLSSINKQGQTPLHRHLQHNQNKAVVLKMLELGVDLELADFNGNTPLHLSILRGAPAEVSLLLLNRSNRAQNRKNREGLTPFLAAAFVGDLALLRVLAPAGSNMVNTEYDFYGRNALALAASSGNVTTMSCIVNELGASIFSSAPAHSLWHQGWTSTHFAAAYSHASALRYLLERGASLLVECSKGKTPLELALESDKRGGMSMQQLLLPSTEMGQALSENPEKIVLASAKGCNIPALAWLHHKGINIMMPLAQAESKTSLHIAAMKPSLATARALIRCCGGKSLNSVDLDGSSPLHYATLNENTAIATLFVESGSSINAQNNDGDSPLHIAAENLHLTAALNLLRLGASMSLRNAKGETPPMVATRAAQYSGSPQALRAAQIIVLCCDLSIEPEALHGVGAHNCPPLISAIAAFHDGENIEKLDEGHRKTNDLNYQHAKNIFLRRRQPPMKMRVAALAMSKSNWEKLYIAYQAKLGRSNMSERNYYDYRLCDSCDCNQCEPALGAGNVCQKIPALVQKTPGDDLNPEVLKNEALFNVLESLSGFPEDSWGRRGSVLDSKNLELWKEKVLNHHWGHVEAKPVKLAVPEIFALEELKTLRLYSGDDPVCISTDILESLGAPMTAARKVAGLIPSANIKWAQGFVLEDIKFAKHLDMIKFEVGKDAKSVLGALDSLSQVPEQCSCIERAKLKFLSGFARVVTEYERADFVQRWHQNKNWQQLRIIRSILAVYPWDIITSTSFFELMMNFKNKKIDDASPVWNWFDMYFSCPLHVSRVSKADFGLAANEFNKFLELVYKGDGYEQWLPAQPPGISFTVQLQSSRLRKKSIEGPTSRSQPRETLDTRYSRDYITRCTELLSSLVDSPEKYECQAALLASLPPASWKQQKLRTIDMGFTICEPSKILGITNKSLREKALQMAAGTSNYKAVLDFFDSLGDSMGYSTDEVILLCAKRGLWAFENRDTECTGDTLKKWAVLAGQVAKKLGNSALCFLCECECRLNLDLLIEIGQRFLDLDPSVVCKYTKKKKISTLRALYNSVSKKVTKLKAKQFPESLLNKKLCAFKEVDNPLSSETIESLKEHYEKIKKFAEEHSSQFVNDLAQRAREAGAELHQFRLKEKPDTDPTVTVKRAELIFCLRELVRKVFPRIYPYDTQILALLGIIGPCRDKKKRGCIAQIRTGEGKSITVAMLAAYQALCGRHVDVVTSTESLAMRDCKKYRPFFDALGITASHICAVEGTSLAIPEQFDATILYGVNTDYQFARLRDGLFGGAQQADGTYTLLRQTREDRFPAASEMKSRGRQMIPRRCDVIIVDEADCLILDSAGNSARMSVQAIEDFSWVYSPLFEYVSECSEPEIEDARQYLSSVTNEFDVNALSDDQLKSWFSFVEKAKRLQEGVDYVVKKDNQGKKVGPVEIVDAANTGSVRKGSEWSGGLHQFVQVKEGLNVGKQSATGAAISNAAHFSCYDEVLGVTGTMGGIHERKEVIDVYELESFDVPPHLKCIRKSHEPKCVIGASNHLNVVVEEVLWARENKRPVLVICPTINSAKLVKRAIEEMGVICWSLNDCQAEDEEFVVLNAGQARAVCVATNKAGRGTDIQPSPEALCTGGLHVVFTFLPANSRVEEQGLGRSGRQGQPGSSIIIYEYTDALEQLGANQNEFHYDKKSENNKNIHEYFLQLREKRVEFLSNLRKKAAVYQKKEFKMLEGFFNIRHLVASWCHNDNSLISRNTAKSVDNRDPSPRFAKISSRLPAKASAETVAQRLPELFIEEWARFFTKFTSEDDVDRALSRFLKEVLGGELSEVLTRGEGLQDGKAPKEFRNFFSAIVEDRKLVENRKFANIVLPISKTTRCQGEQTSSSNHTQTGADGDGAKVLVMQKNRRNFSMKSDLFESRQTDDESMNDVANIHGTYTSSETQAISKGLIVFKSEDVTTQSIAEDKTQEHNEERVAAKVENNARSQEEKARKEVEKIARNQEEKKRKKAERIAKNQELQARKEGLDTYCTNADCRNFGQIKIFCTKCNRLGCCHRYT